MGQVGRVVFEEPVPVPVRCVEVHAVDEIVPKNEVLLRLTGGGNTDEDVTKAVQQANPASVCRVVFIVSQLIVADQFVHSYLWWWKTDPPNIRTAPECRKLK